MTDNLRTPPTEVEIAQLVHALSSSPQACKILRRLTFQRDVLKEKLRVREAATKVIFTHDDEMKKWECHVSGVEDAREAKQAFSAVVLTCQQLDPRLLVHTQVSEKLENDTYKITAAV